MTPKIPTYRFQKSRNCAVVTLGGRDHYLGEFGSPESWEKYHRLVAQHLADRNKPKTAPLPADLPLTVVELIAAYWRYAKSYYLKNGKHTSEIASLKQALRFLKSLYGRIPACEFSPKKLKALREAMIVHPIIRKFKELDPATGEYVWKEKIQSQGLSRRLINKQIGRIRRLFAWGVEEELVRVEVHLALMRVKGLKKHKSAAREKARVKPVAVEEIQKVTPHVPPTIRSMIEIQQLVGARPQEVVMMRAEDIVRDGPTWEYRPSIYKTEHHNDNNDPDRERVLFIGPRGQAVLAPYLAESTSGYLFSPIRSEQLRNADRCEKRITKVTPSQAKRKPKGRKKAPLWERYDVASYRRAIRRACLKLGIAVWTPNQLRHTRLTEIRKQFGLEASRVVGGHTEVGTTQIYAEQDHELAKEVMQKIG